MLLEGMYGSDDGPGEWAVEAGEEGPGDWAPLIKEEKAGWGGPPRRDCDGRFQVSG